MESRREWERGEIVTPLIVNSDGIRRSGIRSVDSISSVYYE